MLVPSRYEPCGLSQMVALRYGAVPVVRRTGGLADTIVDVSDASATQLRVSGCRTRPALLAALRRALARYRTPARWQALQRRGMRQAAGLGWDRAARAYPALLRQVHHQADDAFAFFFARLFFNNRLATTVPPLTFWALHEFRDAYIIPGGVHALKDLNLEIAAGQMVVIVGLSGAGKSTLVRAIDGLVPLSAGDVVVGGTERPPRIVPAAP